MAKDQFCCFRVHTVGIVLGWLGIITSALGIVALGLELGFTRNLSSRTYDYTYSSLIHQSTLALLLGVPLVALVLIIINLLASVLLIFGTVKNNHLLILPWLVNNSIGILVIVLSAGIAMITSADSSKSASTIILVMIFIFGILLLLSVTSWWAIFKLFRTIRDQMHLEIPLHMDPITPEYKRM